MGRKIFIGLLALIGLLVISFGVSVFKMKGQLDEIDRTPVDMTRVSDGVYEGHSETELVKVDVQVTVEGGMIEDIKILKHECGKGKPAEALLDIIIEKNDVEVDAVSGATASSEVIKDAVRKALRNG